MTDAIELARLEQALLAAERERDEFRKRLVPMREAAQKEFGLGLMPWLLNPTPLDETAGKLASILSGWHEQKQRAERAEAALKEAQNHHEHDITALTELDARYSQAISAEKARGALMREQCAKVAIEWAQGRSETGRAIGAAIRALPDPSPPAPQRDEIWRPIETAPQGQILIGWHNPDEPDGLGDIDIAEGVTPDSYWNGNGNLTRREPGRSWPTHWAKIPPCRPAPSEKHDG